MKRILVIAVSGLVLLAATSRAEDKKVAHLGVTTAPVDEALGTQLKLPPCVGLVVEYVDADSPAAKALAKNDVLHKLGDQLLVNHAQLQALLRAHKPGDTVTLTVIRAGESRKCEVHLGERAEPEAIEINMQGLQSVPGEIARAIQIVIGTAGSNVIKVLPQISVMISSNISAIAGVQSVTTTVSNASQVCVKANKRGTFTLTCTDGKKRFTAISKDGKTLFDGPVNTTEERDKLSVELKKELAELEKTAKPPKTK